MQSRIVKLAVYIVAVCFIAGCATGHHQIYAGPALAHSQIAILNGRSPVWLREIDGIRGPNTARGTYNADWDGTFEIELLPGSHTLKVSYGAAYGYNLQTIVYSEESIVTLEAEPGAVYVLYPEISGTRWSPQIRRIK